MGIPVERPARHSNYTPIGVYSLVREKVNVKVKYLWLFPKPLSFVGWRRIKISKPSNGFLKRNRPMGKLFRVRLGEMVNK